MQVKTHPHPQAQPQPQGQEAGNSTTMLHPQTYNLMHFSKLSSHSVCLKLLELFEKLNVKLCLVPLDPFSKKPSVNGWTDPDYNDLTYSWARHYGNVGIIPGRSKLLIIDCDTDETVNFFMKLAEEIDLSTDTLVVKTRRGKHFYYYCEFSSELEKKQFTLNNIKLDILAGNKCQAVAPFSLLKLDQNGNVLDPRAENYILFEYTPVNIPSRLPEITKEKYEKLLEKLESSTQKSKKPLRLPPYIETTETIENEERELTDEEIEKLIEIINDYFTEGQRQNLILYLAGYLRKELNVSEESILKLYEHLQPADDPRDIKARIAAIRKTFEKDPDQVAGWMGLAETLGEETAKDLCYKIEQTLKIKTKKKKELIEELIEEPTQSTQKYVYIEIERESKKFARCNYNTLTIEIGTFKKNEIIDKYFYVVKRAVLDCCIGKIYAIENPLTKEKKYEIHFISKNSEEPYTVLKGTVPEIWEELKTKTSYVLHANNAQNVFTYVFSYFIKQGWYEKKKEELPQGFYYIDGKFVACGFEEKEYTKEDLQKAALFLNEYIYSHPNPTLIASIIRAGILLPFAFAQKQLVLSGKLRKRMKYLYLYGETKTGKTTTALLLQHIWGWDCRTSYASFNTESRAGKYLSSSTFPVLVDEVAKGFEQNAVKELLKHSQEDILARSIQSRTLKTIQYLALAPVIMTSNVHFPDDPALLERFFVFRFKKTDKISNDKRARYEREDFKVLTPLGQFIWKYVRENGLRDDYIEYANEILKAFYKEAGIEAEWLNKEFRHNTGETEEEQRYNRESEFYNAVINFFSRNVKPRENLDHGRSIYYALKELTFGRWIWIDSKDYVNISKDFLNELKKFYRCEIRDLEELSEITGWEKLIKRYEYTTVWVVRTTAIDFFYRLNYIPQLLDTDEFKLWTMGKFTPEAPAEPPKVDFDKPFPEESK
jgi:hypothetical protein